MIELDSCEFDQIPSQAILPLMLETRWPYQVSVFQLIEADAGDVFYHDTFAATLQAT